MLVGAGSACDHEVALRYAPTTVARLRRAGGADVAARLGVGWLGLLAGLCVASARWPGHRLRGHRMPGPTTALRNLAERWLRSTDNPALIAHLERAATERPSRQLVSTVQA